MWDFLKNKTVLVTGGTGSFGQRFVKTLLEKTEVAKVIVFSRDELKQSQMLSSIADPYGKMRYFIGDVRDLERLQMAFRGVDFVVHAAALKQVPALEYNPFEAIKTNILGTKNVISAALDQKVAKVVLVSTDKAASPTTLYGATKLCAERLVISSNAYVGVDKSTRLSAVRYGNVFGSRGSLIKVMEEQRSKGEINLTHEEMTRFWITLDQGVNLVMLALEKMHGGEIFVPKIPSMKIVDMITSMAPDCKIKKIGIRPGEKLHEVLVTSEEARHTKEYDNYYIILPEFDWWTLHDKFKDGRSLDENFLYASNMNNDWLDKDRLDSLLDIAG